MNWHHDRVLSFLKDAELVDVADPDTERCELAGEKLGLRWSADYTQLHQEVEAVVIAVPTLLHYREGMTCIDGGLTS